MFHYRALDAWFPTINKKIYHEVYLVLKGRLIINLCLAMGLHQKSFFI